MPLHKTHLIGQSIATVHTRVREGIGWIRQKGLVSPGTTLAGLALLTLVVLAVHFYDSYTQTQILVNQTAEELSATQAKLANIASSTSQKLADQEQKLSDKDKQIQTLEADVKATANASATGVDGKMLTALAPSVVKVVCASDAYSGDLQEGSGTLYRSPTGVPSTYFVETNVHVVQTTDGSPSRCVIALYPNYQYTSSYFVYQASGYQTYKYGADFAYLVPETITGEHAGTTAQLTTYAKTNTSSVYCATENIGDHISILGYPGVGGTSLTVTDGIISGFEYDEGFRYVKTSAKIEHGNSGGIAVEDSGCVVGIPTFVETGQVESIGRILDLHNLFNT